MLRVQLWDGPRLCVGSYYTDAVRTLAFPGNWLSTEHHFPATVLFTFYMPLCVRTCKWKTLRSPQDGFVEWRNEECALAMYRSSARGLLCLSLHPLPLALLHAASVTAACCHCCCHTLMAEHR